MTHPPATIRRSGRLLAFLALTGLVGTVTLDGAIETVTPLRPVVAKFPSVPGLPNTDALWSVNEAPKASATKVTNVTKE